MLCESYQQFYFYHAFCHLEDVETLDDVDTDDKGETELDVDTLETKRTIGRRFNNFEKWF